VGQTCSPSTVGDIRWTWRRRCNEMVPCSACGCRLSQTWGRISSCPRPRGASGPEAAFCLERTIDLIARDLQLDPAAVRRQNFIPPEAFPYETPTGLTYDFGGYAKALDRALELSEYHRWRARPRQPGSPDGPLFGVGLATVVKGSGGRV